MPESRGRKVADAKKTAKRKSAAAESSMKKVDAQNRFVASRDWVPYVFIPVGLLGVAWLVVFYIAGPQIPFMAAIGNWNFGIGMGLITAAFFIATLWK